MRLDGTKKTMESQFERTDSLSVMLLSGGEKWRRPGKYRNQKYKRKPDVFFHLKKTHNTANNTREKSQ